MIAVFAWQVSRARRDGYRMAAGGNRFVCCREERIKRGLGHVDFSDLLGGDFPSAPTERDGVFLGYFDDAVGRHVDALAVDQVDRAHATRMRTLFDFEAGVIS